METIMAKISAEKSELERSRFIEWLRREDVSVAEKFSFVPAMVFFIMGFRDILDSLKQASLRTPVEKLVSQHCEEDAGHWCWYVEDLSRLGFDLSAWGRDLTSFFTRLWSSETQECRNLVYSTTHYVRSAPSPEVLLVIVEVMEATFGVFSDALYASLRGTPAYSELEFFGSKHRQMEQSHSIGNWTATGNHSAEIYEIPISREVEEAALNVVDDLFSQFHKMFDEWYLSRDSYSKTHCRFFSHAESLAI